MLQSLLLLLLTQLLLSLLLLHDSPDWANKQKQVGCQPVLPTSAS